MQRIHSSQKCHSEEVSVYIACKKPPPYPQSGKPPPCICLSGNLPISGHRNLASSLSLHARHAESSLLISTSERCNCDQTHSEPRVLVSSALVLLRLSLRWSQHDRPLIQRWVVGVRNNDFTQKDSSLRRQQAYGPQRTILPELAFGLLLYYKGGVKSNTSCSPSASGGDMLISSSLQAFAGGA